ncbi:hypothetical protein LTR37_009264, partial [Vermiconidia calcicola]
MHAGTIITALLLLVGTEGRREKHRVTRARVASQQPDFADLRGEAACTIPLPPEVKAPKKNVWDFLTRTESHDIAKWLATQKFPNTTEVYRTGAELMLPNKTDVLQYLDGNGPEPARYASVQIYENLRGKTSIPMTGSILVGPLPISNATTWQPLTYPYTKKDGKTRVLLGDADWRAMSRFTNNITNSVKDITKDLWGNKTSYSSWSGQDPVWQYDNKITQWSQYWGSSKGDFYSSTLLPLGLYYGFEFDLLGIDQDSWKFKGWLYNGVHYPTTEDFREAYFSPGFEKLDPNLDGEWTHTDPKDAGFPLDREAPPMPLARSARFSVDYRQKYVEWMGFSFYLAFQTETGMTMYDIRFKGERIIYELGIQEALAHYAGNDPVQSGTSYLDSAYGLGYAQSLMPGYDCPTYASYLNITLEGGGYGSTRDINGRTPDFGDCSIPADYMVLPHPAICLFEFDADYSIQRHSSQSNTKNTYFVVRTISTVGNYDYSFSYEFYMDGSIQVIVRAAGYIQSAYYAKNDDYGYHIHDALSGSMHDHVL